MTIQNSTTEASARWNEVYLTKGPDTVSWFREHLETSLRLLEQAGLSPSSRVIDVGGGASTLVDDLLARGINAISVLDLSEAALNISRQRLGDREREAHWLAGDVLAVALPAAGFDFWHDRAVLHFLTDHADAVAYVRQATATVAPGGFAVIGGFAPDGPPRCSGQPVARRSEQDIAGLFASGFVPVTFSHEVHETPAGSTQAFLYAVLKRV